MQIANIYDAKTNFSQLINQVIAGEEIIIAKAGKPVAKMVAYKEKKQLRKPGYWEGKIWISPDFDEEDEEINAMFYGKDK